ncbi:MAG TPA: NAD-dependent epimerase/dehydratase family protein [Nocardioides sp.]|nr:NAD-dependent epimerase/dehydratase family protein [Nocardioides sp.]
MSESGLVVAVTGPTGTFGHGLMPQLQADDRVARVVGVARRPFDPASEGWTKMEYRQGDVRDQAALAEAFAGADVVVHLAFVIVGGNRERTRAVNVEGTLNAFRAAAAAGARRFVYASSVAAYGFHRDNPVGMREDWPTRPADRLFYAQEKAELEHLLEREAARHDGTDLYLLRPPVVLGPHAVGAKAQLPALVQGLGRRLVDAAVRTPVPLPVLLPDLRLQLIHEEDVGLALLQCVVGAGPPGAYNIAADDVVGLHDVARELGMLPLPVPTRPTRAGARLLARAPRLPQVAEWVEAAAHPALMDTTRARTELGWEPQWSAIEALRDTVRG